MKNDANRRLANVKSRSELGLDYVMLQLEIMSPLGRRTMKEKDVYKRQVIHHLCLMLLQKLNIN